MNKLTQKEQRFAELCVELSNQSEAYRRVYKVNKENSEWVKVKASEIANKDNVRVTINNLKEDLKQEHKIDRDYIVKGLLEIISDADYTFNLGKDSKLTKDDSKAFYRIMQQTKNTDKLRALETLAKMLGLNEPEKHEHKIEQIEIIEKKR